MNAIKPPIIKEPGFFRFPEYKVCRLDNGIPVHCIPFNSLGYTNILLSVKAGTQCQSKLLQASSTSRMLREGCKGYTSESLAEELDFYGTSFQAVTSTLSTEVMISSVSKHLPKMLPLLTNIVFSPTFPEREFNITREIGRQNLIHSMQEVSFLSNRQLKSMMFGDGHVYAKSANPEDYDQIVLDDLVEFHRRFYLPDNVEFFVSGRFSDSEFRVLNDAFGQLPASMSKSLDFVEPEAQMVGEARRFCKKDGCLQNSVSMGCVTIAQQHPDFLKLKLLVSVLGGFFGSRLMSNIREDKGYTYGIYAQLVAYSNMSTIVISSQTAVEHTDALIAEVYKEIERLINEPVPVGELEMVKSYYAGMYLQQVSKGMDLVSDYRVKVLNKIDPATYYMQWWNVLHSTTPEDLLLIARKYLKPESFRISVAGKC